MKRDGHNNVDFFVGTEVEHTPAFGRTTLFVVGVHSYIKVIEQARLHNCTHVYFGANMSFTNPPVNDGASWAPWESMIRETLEKGFWATLDVDISCVEGLCESGLCEHANFIPMISAKLPYIRQLGYNATLKLDDKDFAATNPGVWCHSLHQLQKQNQFTHWSKYSEDKVTS
jgi:hypothetical protein